MKGDRPLVVTDSSQSASRHEISPQFPGFGSGSGRLAGQHCSARGPGPSLNLSVRCVGQLGHHRCKSGRFVMRQRLYTVCLQLRGHRKRGQLRQLRQLSVSDNIQVLKQKLLRALILQQQRQVDFFLIFLKNLFDHNFSSIKSQASKISVRFKQKENGNLKKLDGIMTRCFIPDKVDL